MSASDGHRPSAARTQAGVGCWSYDQRLNTDTRTSTIATGTVTPRQPMACQPPHRFWFLKRRETERICNLMTTDVHNLTRALLDALYPLTARGH
jgi:hypothetical protein